MTTARLIRPAKPLTLRGIPRDRQTQLGHTFISHRQCARFSARRPRHRRESRVRPTRSHPLHALHRLPVGPRSGRGSRRGGISQWSGGLGFGGRTRARAGPGGRDRRAWERSGRPRCRPRRSRRSAGHQAAFLAPGSRTPTNAPAAMPAKRPSVVEPKVTPRAVASPAAAITGT